MERQPPQFFVTPGHPCNYLAEREATILVADPDYPKTPALYALLSRVGFRRSGSHIYRPRCAQCNACIPVRISTLSFHPRRIHRRVCAANQDLNLRVYPARFEPDHFALYRRYIRARHAGGDMDDPSPERYRDFLISPWCDTLLFEYSLGTTVLAVAVIDRLTDALSCIYTFFDPTHQRRSLGTYAILRAIDAARQDALEWLYLGYYIADSRKMRYKANYLPQQRFIDDRWETVG